MSGPELGWFKERKYLLNRRHCSRINETIAIPGIVVSMRNQFKQCQDLPRRNNLIHLFLQSDCKFFEQSLSSAIPNVVFHHNTITLIRTIRLAHR